MLKNKWQKRNLKIKELLKLNLQNLKKNDQLQKDLKSGSQDKINKAMRKIDGPPGPKKTSTSHQMMERKPGHELKKVKGKFVQVPYKKAGGSISKYYASGGNVITGR